MKSMLMLPSDFPAIFSPIRIALLRPVLEFQIFRIFYKKTKTLVSLDNLASDIFLLKTANNTFASQQMYRQDSDLAVSRRTSYE